jgi:hypothetical protein
MTTPMTAIFSPRYRRGFCPVAPQTCASALETNPNRRPRGSDLQPCSVVGARKRFAQKLAPNEKRE